MRQATDHNAMILRPALFLALSATAVFAQDSSPDGQLIEGYLACALGDGDWNTTVPTLGLYGWTHEEDAEMGLVNFQPGVGETTFAYMSLTPDFCHIESLALGTDKAAELLEFAVTNSGQLTVESSETDAEGCVVLMLSNGVSVAITSGGNDPVCTSDTDSGVRFFFGEGQ
jgi:hypothetical protein